MRSYVHCILTLVFMAVSQARGESLADYARNCDRNVGGTVPAFSCFDGDTIPIQGGADSSSCDNPSNLNGKCWSYSRLGKLNSGDPNVEVRFLCRHYDRPTGFNDSQFDDIAVIQQNKLTGATCFYQSPSGGGRNMDGNFIAAPKTGETVIWQTPEVTASQDCVSCHDNRGWIKTPFLKGVTGHHEIPSPIGMQRDNYTFPGDVTKFWRAYSVKSKSQPLCSQCHNMGTSDQSSRFSNGTSVDIGLRSVNLLPNLNQNSWISGWMAGFSSAGASEASARAHSNCATNRFDSDCSVSMFSTRDDDDFTSGETSLFWKQKASTAVRVNAGDEIPRLVFRAGGGNGSTIYFHGHPSDECSWDNPRQEGDSFVITGRTPTSGRFTLSGLKIKQGPNFCQIRVIAQSGGQSLELDVTVQIDSGSSGGQTLWNQKIRNVQYGDYCINLQHASDSEPNNVYQCRDNPDQKWTISPVDGAYRTIKNEKFGMCLNAQSPDEWQNINVYRCAYHPDQHWEIINVGNGMSQIRNRNHTICVSLEQGRNKAPLISRHCNSSDAKQLWRMGS